MLVVCYTQNVMRMQTADRNFKSPFLYRHLVSVLEYGGAPRRTLRHLVQNQATFLGMIRCASC